MGRKQLIRTDIYPYHVTTRSNNRDWFDLPLSEIWAYCQRSLAIAYKAFPVQLQAFVLMNNHYHLLLWTPESNLDKFMFMFNKNLSKQIRERTGRINRIFGDRYRWSLISNQKYYQNVLRYVYQNPMRANLILRCEEYAFSTLYYIHRDKNFIIPLHQPYFGSKNNFLNFVNQNVEIVDDYKLHHALNQAEFKMNG